MKTKLTANEISQWVGVLVISEASLVLARKGPVCSDPKTRVAFAKRLGGVRRSLNVLARKTEAASVRPVFQFS